MKISILIQKLKDNPDQMLNQLDNKGIDKLIKHLSESYYNKGISLVSDQLFDYVKEYAEDKFKLIVDVGAPIKAKQKVKLPLYMGSLDKIKPDSDTLQKWLKEYKGSYVLSYKLDGISALLQKVDDKLKLYTRGDGKYGQDITLVIPHINFGATPNKILESLNNNDCIRGELIMTKKNFEKLNKNNEWANARNTVAGVINTKIPDKTLLSLIDFVGYWVLEPPMKQSDQLNYIIKNKINCVEWLERKVISVDILSEMFISGRDNHDYEIDGVVVLDNSQAYPLISGENPKYGFAFKQVLTNQIAETTVLDVLWEVSKDMYIKPKIKITPVNLVGSTIQYATANNAKFVYDNKLGPGSRIRIIKSGDIIPKIMEILSPSDNKKPKMPDIKYEWNDTEVDIIATNLTSELEDKVQVKKLTYFFKTLNIKFMGEGTIEKFVNNKYDDLWKILTADKTKLEEIEGFGEKAIENIYNAIDEGLQNRTLAELMSASQLLGRGIGVKKFTLITDVYPNILELYEEHDDISELINNISGFDEKTTDKILEGMDDFIDFMKKLTKIKPNILVTKRKKLSKKEQKECKYNNITIVFTGFRDKEAQKKLEECGCKVTDSVSKNTDLVVAIDPDETSGKITKAKSLGIRIISREEFIKNL